MSALTIKNNSRKCSQCLRAEMLKKKENKTKLALFVLPVRLRYRHISYQLIARFCHFSHFLFNLKKTTMNLLAVVKINSMTFTDRNLYTRKKKSISFSKQLYLSCKPSRSGHSFASEWISNYTQAHHKIHEGPSV